MQGHHSQRARSVEWYTPEWVFQRLALDFDLDPCHPVPRRDYLPARHVYTRADDGLSQSWHGRVWLNPPYGKDVKQWMDLMSKHGDGVALVFARTDTAWFQACARTADSALFVAGRIKFIDGDGIGNSGAGAGSVLLAWGPACDAALERVAREGMGIYVRFR
jgi:phage N-6-adenine-methyltransferase